MEEITAFLDARVEETQSLPPRTRYQFLRLVTVLARLLRHMGEELAQSSFVPAGFEVLVDRDGQAAPYQAQSPGGIPVSVSGKIDRVDIMELPPSELSPQGARAVRVVDYKTGGRKFELAQVIHGLNLQMLLYLFALCEGGRGQFQGLFPAGILYMPAGAEAVTVERKDSPEKREKQGRDAFRMNGLLLSDDLVLEGMDKDLSGRYIPVYRNKDGSYKKGSPVAGLEEFARLNRYIRRLAGQMADRLAAGEIAPSPAVAETEKPPCERCDYRAVCTSCARVEEREIPRMSGSEALAWIRKQEGDEEDGSELDAGTAQRH